MSLDVITLLRDLVAIPSVNPMGQPVSGPIYRESRMTAYLEDLFRRLGIPYERDTVEPERDNIVTVIEGDSPEVLLFEVHQDTVPVEGMTIDPFGGELRDGRIWGRGACDVKGGMAAMIAAAARLHAERPAGRPTLVLACTVNEEYGFTGASALTQLWKPGRKSLIPRAPDACIVAEPTELDVVVAHRGIVRWRCNVHGRAAHTSNPSNGVNAIYKMTGVVRAFQRYHEEVAPTLTRHPLCGHPTVCVSTISGGVSVNTVPDLCSIEIDRRLVPGEEPEQAFNDIIAYIAAQNPGVEGIEHEPPYRAIKGLSDEHNAAVAKRLHVSASQVAAKSRCVGVPYGTDGSVISAAGIPTVVFGPGSIEQAHTADEWLAVDQLEAASEVYYRFACKSC